MEFSRKSSKLHQDSNQDAEYYRRAVQVGNALAGRDANVHLVGHSLGGGLASAAQGGSGLTASTYNAAGLHPATVARYSSDAQHMAPEPEKINAIRVAGEVLTKTQEDFFASKGLSLLANDAVGVKRDVAPSHNEEHFSALKRDGKADQKDNYDTYLHGMDEVIDSLEEQKKQSEEALRMCLNRRQPPCQ